VILVMRASPPAYVENWQLGAVLADASRITGAFPSSKPNLLGTPCSRRVCGRCRAAARAMQLSDAL
jgi:hypothetical protein